MHLWNRQILNKINPIHAFSQVIAAYYLFCLTWAYISAWNLNLFFDSPAVAPTWYLYVIVGLSAVSFFLLPKNNFARGNFNLSKSLWCTIFAAFISTLLFRFIFVHHTGLWLDELAELDLSTKYWPIIACAGQTQPPLTCVLTTIGIKYFGYTEFAGRFHVVVASATASAFFVLSLWGTVKNKLFIFLYTVALVVPAIVIQYAYEVRPIALAIMHTLMLIAWLNFLLTKKITRFDLFYFTSSGVLLLLSVGLQSAFAMASLFLALVIMSLFLKTKRYLGLLFAIFSAIGIYFPLQLYIFKQTHLSVLPGTSLAPIHVFFTYLKQESWNYFISQSGTFGYVFTALIATTSVITAICGRRLISSQKDVLERYFIYTLTTLFFYLLLPAYFKAYIPFGNLQGRYTLIGWPLVLLSIASGVQFILGFNFKSLRLPIHAFAFLLIASVFSLNFVQGIDGWHLKSSYTFTHLEKRMELRGFYNWLKTATTAEDVVFRACLRTETEFCSLNLTYPGAAVYYRDAKNSARLRPKDIPFEMYNFLSGNENFHRMFVFFESYAMNKIQVDGTLIANLKDTEYIQVHEISVLIFSGDRKTVINNWRRFIENVEERNPGHNLDTSEYLLQLALIDKDRNSFVKYRELWRDIGARTNSRLPSLEAYDRLMDEKLSETPGEQNE